MDVEESNLDDWSDEDSDRGMDVDDDGSRRANKVAKSNAGSRQMRARAATSTLGSRTKSGGIPNARAGPVRVPARNRATQGR